MKHVIHHWMSKWSPKIEFTYWDDETDRVYRAVRKIEEEDKK